MNFTNNIVCNNCTGARLYQQLGWEYNNPFMWTIIQPEDMVVLMKEWENIDFNKYELLEGEIYSGQEYVKRYYTLIDNKVKVWWIHYIQDDLYETPTTLTDEVNRYSDIHYKFIKDYINEKYNNRVKRMKSMPTFLIVKDNGWGCDYNSVVLPNNHKKIIVSNETENITNKNEFHLPLKDENIIDLASRIQHYWHKPKRSVLTYIIGDYEKVHEIEYKDDDTEYILVTDNYTIQSKTWNVYYDKSLSGSAFDKCFYIRYNPFKYVHTETCLKIDGSITIKKSLKTLFDTFEEGNFDISLMIHPYRNLQIDEYKEWVKSRKYPQQQADKCLKYINDVIGIDTNNYKGLYQVCYEIQRNNTKNNELNEETFKALKELGTQEGIERLDQTIFSAIFNKHYADMKVMWVNQMLITNSDLMIWNLHNSSVPIQTLYEIEPYAFNKPCTLTNIVHKQPKLLILSMSCNKQDFIDEENAVRDTWAKPILNHEIPNVEWYAYRGGALENCIDKNTHTIFIKESDDFLGTFNKTTSCFSFIKEHIDFDFDYVLRTNCCTYINVQQVAKLLPQLRQDAVYTNEVNSYYDKNLKERLLSFSGAFMLFSRNLYNLFIQKNYIARVTDDCVFSNVFRLHYKYYPNHLIQLESDYFEDNNDISSVYCIKLKSFANHLVHSKENVLEHYHKVINKGNSIRKRSYKIGKYQDKEENASQFKYTNISELFLANNSLVKFDKHNPKKAIFAIMSNANSFIVEWVKHHLNLGFDTIYINDNNPIDGEKILPLLKQYVIDKKVVILNNRGDNLDILGIDSVWKSCLMYFGNEYGTIYQLIGNQWITSIDFEGCNTIIEKETPIVEQVTSVVPPLTEDNTEIFVLGYKQFKCPIHNDKLYRIVNLNAEHIIKNDDEFHYDVPIIYTDTKNTISNKNNMYDEWSGIYWLWKNYDWNNTEYIGLCQYRRYFEFLDKPNLEYLNGAEMNVGQGREGYAYNNARDYEANHNIDDLTKLIKVLADSDKESANLFLNSRTFFPSNLLLLNKKDFFDFCAFCFGYIKKFQLTYNLMTYEQIEQSVKNNINKYPNRQDSVKYQSQMLAFLMERLTNIWISKQLLAKRKIRMLPCVETEKTGQNIFKYLPI